MTHVTIESYDPKGAHIGIYEGGIFEDGDQQGGAYAEAEDGLVLLHLIDKVERCENITLYIINLATLTVTKA